MDFDYFYGRDSESFRFIRLPIVLIEDEKFKGLSIDAKVLYSMYLSRSTLSYKNNWIDENKRVYIYFTVEETSQQLGCAVKKAVKLIKDLEVVGLIEKKRTGQGNPTKIYVKDFMSIFRNENFRPVKRENPDLSKGQVKNGDYDKSRMAKKTSQDLSKRQPNYIENNKIDKGLHLKGNEIELERSFMNIITNAVNFSPNNSTITINANIKNRNLIIEVKDQGKGFSEKILKHGKEQFFMEDESRTESGHHGLGLYITNNIIKNYNGELILSNDKNGGGVVQVIIPLVRG